MISKILGEVFQIAVKVVVIILAVVFLINGGKWAYAQGYDLMVRTPSANAVVRNVDISIPKGSSTETIAVILSEAGLIDSTMYFRLIARMNSFDSEFQYGDYTFSTAQSEEDMMEILRTEGAKRETKTFTIIEGLTLAEVAESLADQGMCKETDFYSALDNTNWGYKFLESIPELGDRKVKYQGYLTFQSPSSGILSRNL